MKMEHAKGKPSIEHARTARTSHVTHPVLHTILAHPGLAIGIALVLTFVIVALAAPLIAPPQGDDPYKIPKDGLSPMPSPPSPGHPLGTMAYQYDVFYGLVWGTRVALRIGVIVTLGRMLIGVLLGLLSGYYGGLIDGLLMRLTDAFMAFPLVAAAMVVLALYGGALRGITGMSSPTQAQTVEQGLTLSLIMFGWMQYARLIRGNVLAERNKEYIGAATAAGVPPRRIVVRHLLPNVTQGLFVLAASDIGAVVVLVAMFSFIGLTTNTGGVDPAADWGEMLSVSRNWVIVAGRNAFKYWFTYIPPSLAVVLFSMGWNLIGDGLRDILDPRLNGGRIVSKNRNTSVL